MKSKLCIDKVIKNVDSEYVKKSVKPVSKKFCLKNNIL